MGLARELGRTTVAASVVGVASAFGDWLWSRFIPDGAVLPGVLHGVAIFVLLAVVLGWAVDRPGAMRRLLIGLPGLGLAIAAAFYPIAIAIGYLPALLVTWSAMWLGLAALLRWAAGGSWATALTRGGVAALASGLAFWSISGIWTSPSAAPTNYLLRSAQWAWAFWPGFAALLCARPRGHTAV